MEPELRTKEKRILKFRTEDSEDEDVSKTPHHQTRKNERMQKWARLNIRQGIPMIRYNKLKKQMQKWAWLNIHRKIRIVRPREEASDA